jgi:hypothetical protein
MNPFFIFLFICTFVAIVFWFKKATSKQGVSALKGVLIGVGVLVVILVATARLPIFTAIPLLFLAIFRKAALTQLLIPLIKLLAGSASSRPEQNIEMATEQALNILQLTENPSREEIVQSHRKITREINNRERPNPIELARIDAARELLIQEIESIENKDN